MGILDRYFQEIQDAIEESPDEVPSGRYAVRIKSLAESRDGKERDVAVWKLQVEGGVHDGARLILRSYFHTSGAIGMTLRNLKSAGFIVKTPDDMKTAMREAPGRLVAISVSDGNIGKNISITGLIESGNGQAGASTDSSAERGVPLLDDDLPF